MSFMVDIKIVDKILPLAYLGNSDSKTFQAKLKSLGFFNAHNLANCLRIGCFFSRY